MGRLAEKGRFHRGRGRTAVSRVSPKGSDVKIRAAEIHAISILTLDRAEKTEHDGETAPAELPGADDTPF
jgi:hypothetical protein